MINIEDARMEILEEASKNGNQLLKMQTADGYYVKGHSLPDQWRDTYIAALDSLVKDGSLKFVFSNKTFQLFELTACAYRRMSISSATEKLLTELNTSGSVYKIHSNQGEFVQCGDQAFDKHEHERIAFMRALHGLLYSGTIHAVSENAQMCTFQLTPVYKESRAIERKAAMQPRYDQAPMSPHVVSIESFPEIEELEEAS